MSDKNECCKCCKFARMLTLIHFDKPQLCCLRYAPKPKRQYFEYSLEYFSPIYPIVEGNMWCGEFESKEE